MTTPYTYATTCRHLVVFHPSSPSFILSPSPPPSSPPPLPSSSLPPPPPLLPSPLLPSQGAYGVVRMATTEENDTYVRKLYNNNSHSQRRWYPLLSRELSLNNHYFTTCSRNRLHTHVYTCILAHWHTRNIIPVYLPGWCMCTHYTSI